MAQVGTFSKQKAESRNDLRCANLCCIQHPTTNIEHPWRNLEKPHKAAQSDLRATPKPVDSQPIATPKPPKSHPNATLKRQQSHHKAWRMLAAGVAVLPRRASRYPPLPAAPVPGRLALPLPGSTLRLHATVAEEAASGKHRPRMPMRIGFDSFGGLGMLCGPNLEEEILWQN